MRVVRRLVVVLSGLELLVLIIVAGCGGSSPAPAAPSPGSQQVQLQPGHYFLTLTPLQEGNPWVCLSSTVNGEGYRGPMFGRVRISLEWKSSEWVGRSVDGNLEFRLQSHNSYLSGSGSGTAPSNGSQVSLGKPGEAVTLSGSAFASDAAGGSVAGTVTLSDTGGSVLCSTGSWSLSR